MLLYFSFLAGCQAPDKALAAQHNKISQPNSMKSIWNLLHPFLE